MTLARRFSNVVYQVRRNHIAYFLIIPSLIFVLLIAIYPVIYAIDWSVHGGRYLARGPYVGIQNYQRFFSQNSHTLVVSAIYCICSLAGALFLGTLTALLLNQKIKGRTFFRIILLTPWVLSQTVIALLWKWFLDPYYGPVAHWLRQVGLQSIDFLGSPRLALPTLILINVWATYPQVVVLLLAALQTIPREVFEAAMIDGANAIRRFITITLPYLRHTLLVSVIILTSLYFNMVTLIYVTTAGGPVQSTETISIHLFKTAFEQWRLGYASAISVVMLFFNAIISVLYIRILKKRGA